MSDEPEMVPVSDETAAFLDMEYSERTTLATATTVAGRKVVEFLEVVGVIPFTIPMCEGMPEDDEEAVIRAVFWIRAANVIFCSVECAQLFAITTGRPALGLYESQCDTCGGPNDAETSAVVAMDDFLIVSDSCSACTNTDPVLVAGRN